MPKIKPGEVVCGRSGGVHNYRKAIFDSRWSVGAVSPPGPGRLEGGGRSCVSISERESMEALRRGWVGAALENLKQNYFIKLLSWTNSCQKKHGNPSHHLPALIYGLFCGNKKYFTP